MKLKITFLCVFFLLVNLIGFAQQTYLGRDGNTYVVTPSSSNHALYDVEVKDAYGNPIAWIGGLTLMAVLAKIRGG